MNDESNNKKTMTPEESKRLCDFFLLLYKINQRLKREAKEKEQTFSHDINGIDFDDESNHI